jgi:hypothetical protein
MFHEQSTYGVRVPVFDLNNPIDTELHGLRLAGSITFVLFVGLVSREEARND